MKLIFMNIPEALSYYNIFKKKKKRKDWFTSFIELEPDSSTPITD